jgi:hypothetical protein
MFSVPARICKVQLKKSIAGIRVELAILAKRLQFSAPAILAIFFKLASGVEYARSCFSVH